MGKVKQIIDQALIVLASYFRGKRKLNADKIQDKTVLIPYANIFGDIVLLLDCVDEFDKMYPVEEGYQVKFLCKPAVKKFLLALYPECTLDIEVVDWHRFGRDYLYYKEVMEKYSGVYEKVIVPYDHTVTNDLFVRSIQAKEKITQDYDIFRKKLSVNYLLSRNAYTRVITVDKNISVLQRQRVLINQLGNTAFKSRIPYIKQLTCKNMEVPESYAVICPTASYPPKSWSLENFAIITDYLVEKYKCKICVCGGNEDPDIFKRLMEIVEHKTELVDFVNKTDFEQWAELMRGAKIAVCNDSASYHLAAAVKTPAVCIAGDFACVNAPLYEPDIIEKNDVLPLVLYKKMPCEGCRYIGYRYGYGNQKCTKQIKSGKKLLCVQMISVDDVISGIEIMVDKYKIPF